MNTGVSTGPCGNAIFPTRALEELHFPNIANDNGGFIVVMFHGKRKKYFEILYLGYVIKIHFDNQRFVILDGAFSAGLPQPKNTNYISDGFFLPTSIS